MPTAASTTHAVARAAVSARFENDGGGPSAVQRAEKPCAADGRGAANRSKLGTQHVESRRLFAQFDYNLEIGNYVPSYFQMIKNG